jgi:hypothetical protein
MARRLRSRLKSFEGLAAYGGRWLILDGPEPERVRSTLVSGSYFSILRAKTSAGRTFGGQEAEGKDALPLAVLGHGFWQRRFGGDETIVGTTISLNRSLFTVVGIAAREFTGTEATVPDVWVPLATENLLAPESDNLAAENRSWLRIVGRQFAERAQTMSGVRTVAIAASAPLSGYNQI